MLNTLTIALTYHEFFRHSDMAGLAVETGGMGMAVSDSHGDAVGLRTDGLVFKVLHDHFAGGAAGGGEVRQAGARFSHMGALLRAYLQPDGR
jgi:hypothetical protein